ncbi:hypothetical protein P691DRAFT_774702 [Macrolepiota fuliginosa MF-IS2]|uniref:F-box domain-containing protein n=1 Tax=Macrolepiota fuliginosa MF-IS2 TaxID=1400762 RepID=A0A9P5XFR9_9AGAR|nr:hypothetical protein P691DRAFT_774702 [Macrolepiota fuliginosa MF-IS2]
MDQECPQCGYGTTNKSRNDLARMTIQDEITAVQDRVRVLDSEITRLNEERARLLRRCNELQSPVKKYLPPEVLSSIFQFACSLDELTKLYTNVDSLIQSWPRGTDPSNWETNGPYFPVVLGSVCSFWRQVVRSTPQAWTTIALEVRHRTAVSHAHLLRLYLSASLTLPCSVEVDCRREQLLKGREPPSTRNDRLEEALLPIRNVLLDPENMLKITKLRLIAPPYKWCSLIPASYPRLQSLSLAHWPSQARGQSTSLELDLRDSRCLTHCYLTGIINITLPWSQITDLALASLPIATSLDILFQCKNLQSCRIRHPDPISPAPQPVHHQRGLVTLTNLSFLEWAPSILTQSTSLLFGCLNLPALHSLQWDGPLAAPEDPQSWILALQFFARLPTTMTSIHITGESLGGVNSKDLLNALPQLETLMIDGLKLVSAVVSMIAALGLDNPSQAGQPLLPVLRTLDLKDCSGGPPSRFEKLRACLIKMLCDRYLRSDLGLCVKINLQLGWLDDEVDDLLELVRNGYEFELWESGKRVEWIRPTKTD